MRKLWLIVPLLLIVAGCAKSSTPSSSTAPSAAITTTSPAASSAAAATTVKVTTNSTMGRILTDAAGMTLYHFDHDTTGKSNCEAACATTWPPLKFTGTGTPTGSSDLSVIDRTDGTKQVAYKGMPLYTYSGDTSAGQTNGDGFAGIWHVTTVS